jgi:hypothetical protein
LASRRSSTLCSGGIGLRGLCGVGLVRLRLAARQHAGFGIEGEFTPGRFAGGGRQLALDHDLVDLRAGEFGAGGQRIEETLQPAGVGGQCGEIAFTVGRGARADRFQRGDGRLCRFGGVHGFVGIQRSECALHLAEQAAGFGQAAADRALALEGVEVGLGGGQFCLQCAHLLAKRAAARGFFGQA